MKSTSRVTTRQHLSQLVVAMLLGGFGLAASIVTTNEFIGSDARRLVADQEALFELGFARGQAAALLITVDTIFVEPDLTSGALEAHAIAQCEPLIALVQRLSSTSVLQPGRSDLQDVASSLKSLEQMLRVSRTTNRRHSASDSRAMQAEIEQLVSPLPMTLLALVDKASLRTAAASQELKARRNVSALLVLAAGAVYLFFALLLWRRAVTSLAKPLQVLAARNRISTESSGEFESDRAGSAEVAALDGSLQFMARALAATRDSKRVLQAETTALLESIPAILIGLDPDGRVVLWNAAATRNFGLIPNQTIGRLLVDLPIPWTDGSTPHSLVRTLELDKVQLTPEVPFINTEGTRRVLSVTTTPVSHGTLGKGVLVLGTDMTEQLSLESRVRHSQKLESVGQLAAGIAHEINTPIQYVGHSIHFLREAFDDMSALLVNYKELRLCVQDIDCASQAISAIDEAEDEADLELLEEEIPGAIERAIEGVERVANIVGAMKRFAHPGAASFAPANINEAVKTTLTVANNELRYIANVNQQLGSIPAVECDLGDINQVLLNLIVNAAHAIQEKSDEKGTITIRTRQQGERVRVEISDTGNGIPADIAENIFDPFFTTKEVGKGTGQGLAIAHAIVCEEHGGTLTFESDQGKGTTFFIELPLRQKVAA